jgi:hypothetical protein
VISKSNIFGLFWCFIFKQSAKPLVTTRRVLLPLRSIRAFVATVVPILISLIAVLENKFWPCASIISLMPLTVGSSLS